jgi:hypothetical protein
MVRFQKVLFLVTYCLLNAKPNMAVKGTRRTQALLKVGGLFGFVGFGLVLHPARPLLLR